VTGYDEATTRVRSAWIFGVFAWLALALAAVGLHSVVSYTVAQRTVNPDRTLSELPVALSLTHS
jgi:hypothetical protein